MPIARQEARDDGAQVVHVERFVEENGQEILGVLPGRPIAECGHQDDRRVPVRLAEHLEICSPVQIGMRTSDTMRSTASPSAPSFMRAAMSTRSLPPSASSTHVVAVLAKRVGDDAAHLGVILGDENAKWAVATIDEAASAGSPGSLQGFAGRRFDPHWNSAFLRRCRLAFAGHDCARIHPFAGVVGHRTDVECTWRAPTVPSRRPKG